jgi:hypothetical protein
VLFKNGSVHTAADMCVSRYHICIDPPVNHFQQFDTNQGKDSYCFFAVNVKPEITEMKEIDSYNTTGNMGW